MRATRTFRSLAAITLAAVSIGALAACTPAAESAEASATVSVAPSARSQDLGFWAAVDEGYFDDEGLTIKTTDLETRTLARDAVTSGAVNISHVSVNTSLPAFVAEEPLKVVASVLKRFPLVATVSESYLAEKGLTVSEYEALPTADRFATLEGAQFGLTTPGDIFDQTLRAQLKALGISDPDAYAEIQYLQSGPALIAQFQQGSLDVYYGAEPDSEWIADKFGSAIVFSGDDQFAELPETVIPAGAFLANSDWLAEDGNDDVLKKFLAAWVKGNEWVEAQSDDDFATWITGGYPEVTDADALDRLVKAAAYNRGGTAYDGRLSDEEVQRVIDFAVAQGTIPSAPTVDDVRTWQYLP